MGKVPSPWLINQTPARLAARGAPTSGFYESKPLEPANATAGLNLGKSEKEEETTRGFGTTTNEGDDEDGGMKVEKEATESL